MAEVEDLITGVEDLMGVEDMRGVGDMMAGVETNKNGIRNEGEEEENPLPKDSMDGFTSRQFAIAYHKN
jgi:hypothetical protein